MVLLVREIRLGLPALVEDHHGRIEVVLAEIHLSLLVVPRTEISIRNNDDEEQDPRHQCRNYALSVARLFGPQLRRADTAGAVANEEHGVDYSSLRVALYVRRREGEEN